MEVELVHWQAASFLNHFLLKTIWLMDIPEINLLAIKGLMVTEMYFKSLREKSI